MKPRQLTLFIAISHQSIQRADTRDCQCGRSGQTGPSRRFAVGDKMKSGGGFEKVYQLGNQLQALLACQVFDGRQLCFKRYFAIARLQHNATVLAGLYRAMSAQRGGEVDRGGAGMKEIQRPDVDGAAGEIDTSWS
jgi:hypothetical protein